MAIHGNGVVLGRSTYGVEFQACCEDMFPTFQFTTRRAIYQFTNYCNWPKQNFRTMRIQSICLNLFLWPLYDDKDRIEFQCVYDSRVNEALELWAAPVKVRCGQGHDR